MLVRNRLKIMALKVRNQILEMIAKFLIVDLNLE